MVVSERAFTAVDEELDDATSAEQVEAAIFTAMADPAQPRLVFQPVVDLHSGAVVGHETLSRFVSPLSVPRRRWFAEASRLGVGARLQADIARRAIARLPEVPGDTVLTVNLDPRLVTSPEVADVLTRSGRLDGLVIELTRPAVTDDVPQMLDLLTYVRALGAGVAVAGSGAGYWSLHVIRTIKPEFVKLDETLVRSVDVDEVRRALLVMVGDFAGGIGSRVVAEGIETPGELRACIELGVSLGQGWLLGRPTEAWHHNPAPEAADIVRAAALARGAVPTVGPLITNAPAVASRAEAQEILATHPETEHVVLTDAQRRPVGLLGRARREGETVTAPLLARPSERLTHVALRAAARPGRSGLDPVVCHDEAGRYQGIVTVDRLLAELAACDPGARVLRDSGAVVRSQPPAALPAGMAALEAGAPS